MPYKTINSLVHSKMEHSVNNMMMFRLCHSFSLLPFFTSVKHEDKSQKMKLLHMCPAFSTISMISPNCQTFKPFPHNVLEGLLLPSCIQQLWHLLLKYWQNSITKRSADWFTVTLMEHTVNNIT